MLYVIEQIRQTKFRTLAMAVVLMLGLAFFPAGQTAVEAATIDELEVKSQQLQEDIENNNSRIEQLSQEADSLQNKVAELNVEIAQANKEIELTEVNLESL
jgi:peptidoglycan hydrolase CwlO-like protein